MLYPNGGGSAPRRRQSSNPTADANDTPIAEQARDFFGRLNNSLNKRVDIMESDLNRAKQHRQTGAHAARRSCLEQAQTQWGWFTWILENQGTPTSVNESQCPSCGLRKPDQHQQQCRSCYDIEITNAVVR